MVNIIYDNRRVEKYDLLMAELKRQNIRNYKIWDAIIDRKTVVESINASFKTIVEDAKKSGLSEVIIFEDDVMFPAANGYSYFLTNKPKEFDVYIAGTYLLDDPDSWKPPVVKVKEWVGNQCIIIHERYYDRFLELPGKDHVDTANSGKGDFYVCFPFAALQRPGFSRNNMAMADYNNILKDEYVYGKFR